MNNPSPLRNYVADKQSLVSALMALKDLVENSEFEARVQDLLVKLAQDRFNLVVVGQFKRGKSSLMNAILARDLLPTGHLPLTSAITAVRYGPKDRALLKFKGWALEKEIDLAEIREYITEEGNPGNHRGLLYAQIEVASPFLRRGLYFIDTPGIGSSRLENTQTTYEFLPEADAIIFVTSVDGPLTEAEVQFVRDILPYQRKLFIVVNKIDLVEPGELPAITGYIENSLEQVLESDGMRLFPLSAKLGTLAKQQHSDDALQSSGLADFQSALERFLVEEKEQSFLVSTLDRSLQIIAQMKAAGDGDAGKIEVIADTLRSIRLQLVGEAQTEPVPVWKIDQQWAEKKDGLVQEKITRYTQKEKDRQLSGSTCSICSAQSKAIFDFFASYQYDLTRSSDVTQEFLSNKGFCHYHTWQFSQIAAPQGISAGYVLLIEQILAEMQSNLEDLPSHPPEFPGEVHCAACQFLHEMEAGQIASLVDILHDPEKQEQYTQSGGLCLPHMSLLLRNVADANVIRLVLETQMRRFEELSEDMRGFLLKRTAVQRGLLNSEEQSAWLRALIKMAGDRTVYHHR